ncbi:MAG: glycosyl transferase [Verrucomicrobiaceae bacterium]|nr:MAG: glycosyl transferase [Verrucomicrobiaceae bacterium]
MDEPLNIITLKWGTRYGPHFVNKLRNSVSRHLSLPHRFICFTDDPTGLDAGIEAFPIPEINLPPAEHVTGWRKLCLFRTDLPVEGLGLFLDLDIVITGSLDDFFTFGDPLDIPIIHNWVPAHKKLFRTPPRIGNSSVFRFPLNRCGFVLDQFRGEKSWALANFRPPQAYLTRCIHPRMKFWPATWVRSFKRHCVPSFPINLMTAPRLPDGARIIAFHGRPDPDEVVNGYRGKKPHHHTRPAPWVAEHWR